MKTVLALFLLGHLSAFAQTITETFGSGTNQFSVDFVEVGNPGNSADTTGAPSSIGSVNYIYNIGKFEISRDQIIKATSAGILHITLMDMTSYGGNGPHRPATGINWYEAALFVNYLNVSQGHSPAYNFTGPFVGPLYGLSLWGPGDAGYSPDNPFRNTRARYFLPSRDEWYKAAYGSPDGTWYDFPTGSDSAPISVTGGTAAFSAVYLDMGNLVGITGPADVTNAGGLSAFGAMAMGGNVWEWTETAFDGVNSSVGENREFRGGDWASEAGIGIISSSPHRIQSPGSEPGGFRVAMVPEPSSLSLLLAGGAVLMAGRRRG